MDSSEIATEYERNTGQAIVRAFRNLDYRVVPAVLVANHGPFAWGKTATEAAHNAVILESVARTAYRTVVLNAGSETIGKALHDKHFFRKHGKDAYYGQPGDNK